MLKIISGKFKGTQLKVTEGVTRPLTDRIRISIFDTINPVLQDSNVLDLYAGSGVFSFEAISRGANSSTAIEQNHKAIINLKENAKKFPSEAITIYKKSVYAFLKNNLEKYSIIFLDPPFKIDQIETNSILSLSLESLENEGLLIVRYPKTKKLPQTINSKNNSIELVYKQKYGASIVGFYR